LGLEKRTADGIDQVAAIIDIDCGVVGGFDEVDEAGLENLAALVARSCNWSGN
jgi:L-methionine (R)-S-oxide reductase